MIKDLYDRLKAGETVHAVNPESGLCFDIAPAYWERIILGYSILIDGEVVPGHKGTLMDRDVITEWAMDLDEQDAYTEMETLRWQA